jgi:phospholipase C
MTARSQYLEPNTEVLRARIRHVVVLMLENRSFDNLLGWLYDGHTIPDGQEFEGLSTHLWNPLENIDSDGIPFVEAVPIEKNGQPKTKYGKPVPNPVDFTLPKPDPGEGFADTTYQLFQKYQVGEFYPPTPINMGFVQNYQNAMLYGTLTYGDAPTNPREIMKTYTPEQTPVLSELARSFAVCDQYHCSVPSQTLPNRSFIHAATSDGHVNNLPDATTTSRTVFNQIQDAIDGGRDLSWRIHGNSLLAASGKKREEDLPGKFETDHFSLTRLTMAQLHDARFDGNFGTLDQFYDACKSNTLPSYSFLEPQFGGDLENDQHPPSDIRPGEQLIADVYNAVKASPAFNETLLVITYDEHGGCYDHYPPQGGAVSPDPEKRPGQQGFLFNRFGVRVPCVVVNPYIRKGLIARPAGDTPYDHTSVIKTIQTCFGITEELTPRSAAAPDLSGVLTLDEPRTTDIPDVKPLAFEQKTDGNGYGVNSLHRLIGGIIASHTRVPVPSDDELLVYIQHHFSRLFIRRA